jgi:hypothetical protein
MKENLRRINAVVDIVTFNEIIRIAEEDNRSLNYVIVNLLNKAIKEKNRKKIKNKISLDDFSKN